MAKLRVSVKLWICSGQQDVGLGRAWEGVDDAGRKEEILSKLGLWQKLGFSVETLISGREQDIEGSEGVSSTQRE